MGEEDGKIDDEFWTKHAEKINSRINGIMKKSMGNQREIYGQTSLNSFAFYSNNIKQCLLGMVNGTKTNVEKLFFDKQQSNKDEQNIEEWVKAKKKQRCLVSMGIETSYQVRSVVKLFD